MARLSAIITGLVVWVAFAAAAQAKEVQYVSQHPVPHKFGGGFCYIDVPHVHNYGPADPRMYRESNDQFYFVGDPAPFDYDGPRYTYYGGHPVAEAEVRLGHPVYCYIQGPHYHWYQPPAQAQFQLSGGAYWYVGNYPPSYYDERPRYVTINEAYAPLPYARPVVDVQVAPVGFRGEVSVGGPGWRAGAVVGGPPAPVYAPPPPAPVVQIGVGINLGGGPSGVVERREVIERREYIDERHHHGDHGRHEGWREEPRFRERPRYESPRRESAPMQYAHPGRGPAREPAVPAQFPHPGRGPAREPAVPAQFSHPGHGPTQEPLRRAAPQNPGPFRGPVPTAPTRGPAPAPAQGHDDHHQNRHP